MSTNAEKPKAQEAEVEDVFMSKVFFFIMGVINNCGKVFILNSAAEIARLTDKKSLMSTVSGGLVLLSCFVKIFNARFFIKFKHRSRILAAIFFYLSGIGVILLSLSLVNFWLSLLGCLVLGIGTSLGDTTNQGFMKAFNPRIVVGWSSGTGFSGLFASSYYNFVTWMQLPLTFSLLSLIPLYFLYYFSFEMILRERNRLRSAADSTVNLEERDAAMNEQLTCAKLPVYFAKIQYYLLNFVLIYFCYYSAITYQAHILSEKLHRRFVFAAMNNIYQFASFIGRCSLNYFRVDQVHYLTFTLIGFFLFMTSLALWAGPLPPLFLYFIIALVGLAAGSGYSCVIYKILRDPLIEKKEKEASLNLNSACADVGVLLNSFAGVILEHALF